MPPTPLELCDGIPRQDEYDAVLQSAVFEEMAAFSEWEYPYVFGKVAEVVQSVSRPRILDAGSGATFLPYYIRHIRQCFEGATVACCDTDRSLHDVFSSLNRNYHGDIEFSTGDIRALPYGCQGGRRHALMVVLGTPGGCGCDSTSGRR